MQIFELLWLIGMVVIAVFALYQSNLERGLRLLFGLIAIASFTVSAITRLDKASFDLRRITQAYSAKNEALQRDLEISQSNFRFICRMQTDPAFDDVCER